MTAWQRYIVLTLPKVTYKLGRGDGVIKSHATISIFCVESEYCINNFFIVFLESFFSMSDLDNGINVVTMSIMYMAFQSPTIISWLYMVNRGKIQTTCWYILEVTGGFLFTVWNKHDNTLCCGAFWFGTLFFNFAMPSKRRSKVVFQKVLFPRCYQPT